MPGLQKESTMWTWRIFKPAETACRDEGVQGIQGAAGPFKNEKYLDSILLQQSVSYQ